MSFSDLGLLPELLLLSPIRATTHPLHTNQAIPAVLTGRDVLAVPRRHRKTASFCFPFCSAGGGHCHGTSRAPRALVLTPTRELAAQVAESSRNYGKYLQLHTYQVFGGVSINPQISNLRSGCTCWWPLRPSARSRQQRAADLSKSKCWCWMKRSYARHGLHQRHSQNHQAVAAEASELLFSARTR